MSVLGTYDGHDVILKNGKFGYYLVYNGANFSIKHATPEQKHQIIDKHNIEEAIALIESHKKQETNPVIKVPPKGAFVIRLGPYGYYFTHDKKFYSIGKRDPGSLTEQDCYDIINEKYNGDKIDLGPTHMNLQPALHYSRKNLPKIKPFVFKTSKKVKPEKPAKPEKNRSSCAYNEGTNRCKYGSPHDAEKCVLNTNGRCERHVAKAATEKVKSVKAEKPEKLEKNRSSCVYNEGTNRCKYGSPHDAEKCVLNANGRCERHLAKAATEKVKSVKAEKPEKLEKNRSSCVYNEGTNRCKYGSPHDAEKCVLNENGHCERHVAKAKVKANVSVRRSRCKNGTRRNQQGECVPK
jgi:uncharacterized protein YbcI